MITVYTRKTPPCSFCENAKAFLHMNSIPHREVIVGDGGQMSLARFKEDFPTVKSFPYVINGMQEEVGGYNELKALFEETARNKLLLG